MLKLSSISIAHVLLLLFSISADIVPVFNHVIIFFNIVCMYILMFCLMRNSNNGFLLYIGSVLYFSFITKPLLISIYFLDQETILPTLIDVNSFAYIQILSVFVFFAYMFVVILRVQRGGMGEGVVPKNIKAMPCDAYLFYLFLTLSIAVSIIGFVFKIGFRGDHSVYLPYRMSGIIDTLRALSLYVFFYYVIKFLIAGSKLKYRMTLFFLLMYVVFYVLATSSRFIILQFIFFFIASHVYVLGAKAYLCQNKLKLFGIIVLVFIMLPLIAAYRTASIHLDNSQTIFVMKKILSGGILDVISETLSFMLFRFSGPEAALPIIESSKISSLFNLVVNQIEGVSCIDYYTFEILNIPRDSITAYTPGLFGELYSYGGWHYVTVFVALMLIVLDISYRKVKKMKNICFSTLAKCSLLFYAFTLFTEGGLIYHLITFKRIPLLLLFLVVMHFGVRLRISKKRRMEFPQI